MFWNATRAIVVLAGTAALAQSTPPGTTPGAPILNRPGLVGRRSPVGSRATDPQGLVAMRERVADMDNSISQMRALLKQMQAKAAKSKATDSLTKTNLQMWELMIGHLNKDLQQLRVTLAAREDLEARRASLYRQADAKAEAEAQAARAAEAARFAQEQNATGTPTPAQAGHGEGQNLAGQPVPTPPTSNSPSPAQTQGSPNSAPPQ